MRATVARQFLRGWIILSIALAAHSARAADSEKETAKPPNIVVIFADDLGYGDLDWYGLPTIRTPNLDRMAQEDLWCSQIYAAECDCAPLAPTTRLDTKPRIQPDADEHLNVSS